MSCGCGGATCNLAPDDERHGTLNGYRNRRCRCSLCRAANTKKGGETYATSPELQVARKARARASRLPRGLPQELADLFREERNALTLRQSREMSALIDTQLLRAHLARGLSIEDAIATRMREIELLEALRKDIS